MSVDPILCELIALLRVRSDEAAWRVLTDALRERLPPVEALQTHAALERLFDSAARYTLPNRHVAHIVHSEGHQTLALVDGSPALLRYFRGKPSLITKIPLGQLADALSSVSERQEAIEALLSILDDRLGKPPSIERQWLQYARFWRVVESVVDPEQERSLSEISERGLGEFAIGDEIGETSAIDGEIAALALLLWLDRARPLKLAGPPDPSELLEDTLAEEQARTSLAREDILVFFDERLVIFSNRDPGVFLLPIERGGELRLCRAADAVAESPRAGQCLASEVGAQPPARVGFDRGYLSAERLCLEIERAILAWGDKLRDEPDADPDRPSSAMFRLVPVGPDVGIALLRAVRAIAPIETVVCATGSARALDDEALVSRYLDLPERRQASVIAALARGRLARLAPDLEAEAGALLEELLSREDPSELFADPRLGHQLIDQDPSLWTLLLMLGDIPCRSRGLRLVSRLWVQDSLGPRYVTSLLALEEPELIEQLLPSRGEGRRGERGLPGP